MRFEKFKPVISFGWLLSLALYSACITAQESSPDNADLLEQYLQEIEQLISDNDLEGARDKLTQAQAAKLRDESLDLIQGQLRLLESLNQSSPASTTPVVTAALGNSATTLTDSDVLAATDLLDSLRVAMENGELDKVRTFTETTPQTENLLNAVFNNYAAIKISVSAPEADEETQSFLATLAFEELVTNDGDTAFPAQKWKTHRVRVIKTDGSWQKVLW